MANTDVVIDVTAKQLERAVTNNFTLEKLTIENNSTDTDEYISISAVINRNCERYALTSAPIKTNDDTRVTEANSTYAVKFKNLQYDEQEKSGTGQLEIVKVTINDGAVVAGDYENIIATFETDDNYKFKIGSEKSYPYSYDYQKLQSEDATKQPKFNLDPTEALEFVKGEDGVPILRIEGSNEIYSTDGHLVLNKALGLKEYTITNPDKNGGTGVGIDPDVVQEKLSEDNYGYYFNTSHFKFNDGVDINVDTELSSTSGNPIANSVLASTISSLNGVIGTKANKKQMFAIPILSSSFVLGSDIEELLTSDYYFEVLEQNCGSWYAVYYNFDTGIKCVESNKGTQIQPKITIDEVEYQLKELRHGNEGEVDSSLPDEYYVIGIPLDLSRENDLALATKILAIALSNGAAHNDYYAAQLSVLQNAVMKTTEEINTVKTTTSVSAIDINLDSKNKAFKLDEMKLTILFPAGTMPAKKQLRIYLYNTKDTQQYLVVDDIESTSDKDYLISCILKKELSKTRRTLTYTKSLNYQLGNVMSIPSWQNTERGPISKIKICYSNPDTDLLPSGMTVKVEGVKL